MSFFDSAVVRAEIAEITELQEEVYVNVFKFPSMTREEKIDHIDLLEKLLDKQRVLYTRLSLSDDAEAVEMRQKIVDSAILMGMPKNVDMNVILSNMKSVIEVMRKQIDTAPSD
tara:strand:+ start:202 stop:543 length:342 start_codon:yes stop_codon:yes gene_type:complete